MKKIFSLAVAAMALLSVSTSCSQQEVVEPVQEEVAVSLQVELPEKLISSTRSFGDGTTAQKLTYAVYEQNNNNPVILGEKPIPMTTTVDIRLIQGRTYTIVFWAQNETTKAYTFDQVKRTITVDYDNVVSNDELRDAFYAVRTYSVTGPINDFVYLYRPFAQVNLGCNELDDPAVTGIPGIPSGLQNMNVSLRTRCYNTLNLIDGSVSGMQDVTFGKAPIPGRYNAETGVGEKFPIDGYEYLNMNYLLVPEDKSLITCNFDICDGQAVVNTVEVNSVPVQRNWQTNIYGRILTSDATFTVEISPAFVDKYDVTYPQ